MQLSLLSSKLNPHNVFPSQNLSHSFIFTFHACLSLVFTYKYLPCNIIPQPVHTLLVNAFSLPKIRYPPTTPNITYCTFQKSQFDSHYVGAWQQTRCRQALHPNSRNFPEFFSTYLNPNTPNYPSFHQFPPNNLQSCVLLPQIIHLNSITPSFITFYTTIIP